MQLEFSLSQAAERSDLDERSFRLLADRRVILATPRTRTQGRGKQKLYTTDEILIAAILAPLLKMGADTFALGDLANLLRRQTGSLEFDAARKGADVYLRFQYVKGTKWRVHIFKIENDAVSVTDTGSVAMQDFIAIRLTDRIQKVESE